jgi:Zn-dependent protease
LRESFSTIFQEKKERTAQIAFCSLAQPFGRAILLFALFVVLLLSLAMDQQRLVDGLISYLCIVILITFHEFGHAWMAWKRGDDTARLLGRITLNPAAHIEIFGTVVLPLLVVFLNASGGGALSRFIIGWGKPVPVNSTNLKNRGFDWVLIALAGPAMNILLAIIAIALARVGFAFNSDALMDFGFRLAYLNFILCFFNLIPVPPLDGSHVMRYFIGMSEETYLRLCQYGFLFVIVVIQIPQIRSALGYTTIHSLLSLSQIFGVELQCVQWLMSRQ